VEMLVSDPLYIAIELENARKKLMQIAVFIFFISKRIFEEEKLSVRIFF
jgi:hypothetical protein